MTVAVPHTFGARQGNIAASELDQNFDALTAYLNLNVDAVVNVVSDFQADNTGAADATGAINAAIAAANGHAVVLIPGGQYLILGTLAANVVGTVLLGQGRSTVLLSGSATGNLIAVTADYCKLFDLTITTAVTRTADAGIFISAASSFSQLWRLYVNTQFLGIHNGGAGTEIHVCYVNGCGSHGVYLDGTIRGQDEVKVYDTQSNMNLGDGFTIQGGDATHPGAGIHLIGCTAATNAGIGMYFVPGSGAGWMPGSVWIVAPELSANNRGLRVDAGNNSAIFYTILGGLIETSKNEAVQFLGGGGNHTMTGVTISGAGQTVAVQGIGVEIEGHDISVANCAIQGNLDVGVVVGATSARTSLVGNNITSLVGGGTQPKGIRVDVGSGDVSIVGGICDTNTVNLSGGANLSANSRVAGVVGLTDV